MLAEQHIDRTIDSATSTCADWFLPTEFFEKRVPAHEKSAVADVFHSSLVTHTSPSEIVQLLKLVFRMRYAGLEIPVASESQLDDSRRLTPEAFFTNLINGLVR